jgi:iron complex outermembrane receptor protein
MYTWPDIQTINVGLFLEDNVSFNCHSSLKITGSISNHYNNVNSEFGLESLQIFYPDMSASNNRVLTSISTTYLYHLEELEYSFGLAYGQRAPSVSEGYGFYLFNSFDIYDYIGNPYLNNENSFEASGSLGYSFKNLKTRLSGSYFHINNYIVGVPDDSLSPMTIGANGVKVYTGLDYATIFNADFSVEYLFSKHFFSKAQLGYNYGQDYQGENLPFISPLSYMASLNYKKNQFTTEINVQGNAIQSQYAPLYGEDETPSYAILNWFSNYHFKIEKSKLNLGIGIENIFDTYYSTFSSWNNIPSMGRNFYMNLTFQY